MIKLSSRLLSLSKLLSKEDKVIDVGCDHSLLGIYLLKNKLVTSVIGSDIVEKAIDGARLNAKKYKSNIDLRIGDGLNVLNSSDDVDTIIISGMGYYKMRKIIEDYKSNINKIKKIVIQTNSKEYEIRKYITSNGFKIEKESIVKDNKIFYTNILFVKGTSKHSKLELRLGPYLLKNKDKLFLEYLEDLILKNEVLLKIIPKNYIILRLKKIIDIKLLKKEKQKY